jgi:hypothetical protein
MCFRTTHTIRLRQHVEKAKNTPKASKKEKGKKQKEKMKKNEKANCPVALLLGIVNVMVVGREGHGVRFPSRNSARLQEAFVPPPSHGPAMHCPYCHVLTTMQTPWEGGITFLPTTNPQWVACGLTNKKNRHSNPTHDERDGL